MIAKRITSLCPRRRRLGMTLPEVMIASAVSLMLAAAVASLTIVSSRMHRSVLYQQTFVKDSKELTETLNREIRTATLPLRVVNDEGQAAVNGNRLEYQHLNETNGSRVLELRTGDGDAATPWDNELVLDVDTSVDGDERVVARWVTSQQGAGAFNYTGADQALLVTMRIGDPLDEDPQRKASDAFTGNGLQGLEINLFVSPRN